MNGGTWWAAVHGIAESWTRLSNLTSLHDEWIVFKTNQHVCVTRSINYSLTFWTTPPWHSSLSRNYTWRLCSTTIFLPSYRVLPEQVKRLSSQAHVLVKLISLKATSQVYASFIRYMMWVTSWISQRIWHEHWWRMRKLIRANSKGLLGKHFNVQPVILSIILIPDANRQFTR